MNILLVIAQKEIEESIKKQLVFIFPDWKFNFKEAGSVGQAIIQLSASNIKDTNLIICDLNLREGDGLELINYLAISKFKKIPLAVTNVTDFRTFQLVKSIISGFQLNCVGVYQSPLNCKNLFKDFLKKASKEETTTLTALAYKQKYILELLNEENLFLHYQPKIDLSSGNIIGFEALARVRSTKNKVIHPEEFVPLAEKVGLNTQLSMLVLNKAITHWKMHPYLKKYSLSINISATDLVSKAFSENVIKARSDSMDIKLLFELTESQTIIDQYQANKVLNEFIDYGILISLDDFGMCHSNFSRLDSFPFSEIKIDKAFVNDIDTNKKHFSIVESLLDLAKKLNVQVTAEGIESSVVLNKLIDLGCPIGQGYYFSKPIPGYLLHDWIEKYTNNLKVESLSLCE